MVFFLRRSGWSRVQIGTNPIYERFIVRVDAGIDAGVVPIDRTAGSPSSSLNEFRRLREYPSDHP